VDLDQIGEASAVDPLPRCHRELGSPLDRGDPAAERRRENDRRPARAGGDVEDATLRPQPQMLAQESDLVRARRVLDLVVALGEGVPPRHLGRA
jgi:hypothetical protein